MTQKKYYPLHCHSEYELIYIAGGKGKEFARDSVREYQSGDLVLIGKNLPHLYLTDKEYEASNMCRILQFLGDIFPERMETRSILSLIDYWREANKGLFSVRIG